MLLNLSKHSWTEGLSLQNFNNHNEGNERVMKEMKELAERYDKAVVEEQVGWLQQYSHRRRLVKTLDTVHSLYDGQHRFCFECVQPCPAA